MLEQKIDHGVTVGDIIDCREGQKNRSTFGVLAPGSLEKFGNVTPNLIYEVVERFDMMKGILFGALQKDGLDPERFLPDIDNGYNVVLERLDTPIAGSFIKYWVIDQ